jgi:hypothetical protein
MPYTVTQLEFLGIHLEILIPVELLEKKRSAEKSAAETPKAETPQPEKPKSEATQSDAEAQAKISEKRKGLLDAVSKLVDPPFAGPEALAGLKSDRESAAGALTAELPTPEQFVIAEKAIAAFGEKVEQEKGRVGEKRKSLADAASKLVDPAFAGAEALSALKSERESANGALSAEFPTPEQLQTAERAIAAFGEKVEQEKGRVGEKRKSLFDAASKLADPPFATGETLGALKSDRETATGALGAELPSPDQLQTAERAIAAFNEKVEQEKAKVIEKRNGLRDALSKLGDAAFASSEALSGLQADRETATAALSGELPTPDQLQAAEKAIAAFGEKLETEKKRVAEKRKGLADAASKLADPDYAGTEALAGLKSEREAATGALSGEFPTAEQFDTAEKAIAAFGVKLELEKKRVGEKRKALQEEAGKLTDPAYGSPEAILALKTEREKATNALTPELPTAAQIKTAEDAIAAFGQKLEEEKQRVIGKRTNLLQQANALTDPDFADAEGLKELKTQRDAATNALADALPAPAQILAAEQAIAAFAQKAEEAKQRAKQKALDLKSVLTGLADPDGADLEEKKATKKERDLVNSALQKEAPTPAEFKQAEKSLARLKDLIKQSSKMGALAAKNPTAATEARKVFKGFRDKMLDQDVTPEMLSEAKKKVKDATDERENKRLAWAALNKVPNNETAEARLVRLTKLQEATNAFWAADHQKNLAIASTKDVLAHEQAVLAEKLLTEATEHGPLSGHTDRPFSDATATKLVQAYAKDPLLADVAVKSATTARHPDAIANGLDHIIGKVADGFAKSDGKGWNDKDKARKYGEDLLKMGGDIGDDYFTRLPEYLDSGQQFVPSSPSPLGDSGSSSFEHLAQKRSVTLAKSFVKADGSIDVTSDNAKKAIGNMLFHPRAMMNQTPSLTAHVLKTVKFLEDPVTGPQATNVLKATVAPTSEGSKKLVRKALGKGDTEAVDDDGTRTSVLASMLKPLHQGKVGSCFSTAPTRRMRETEPLNAMKAYSDIASKGTYHPAGGKEVPVVTNLPEGDDPLQRSWEYTLATSSAQKTDSRQQKRLLENMKLGTDQMRPIVGGNEMDWNFAKAKLNRAVKTSFTFVYDPMSTITDSNDGSSSTGRYVTKRVSSGKEIRTKDEFITEMTEVALTALGITDPSDAKATQVKDLVKSDSFINAICPGKYKPWELPSGGETTDATRALFGDSITDSRMMSRSPTTGAPTEGERTKQVLNSFLKNLGGRPDHMVTIKTQSIHGFNALPNHPSLAILKGSNETETAGKVQTHLIDKGVALKNTDLSVERAGWLFDQEMKKAIDGETDPVLKAELQKGAKAKRPTTAVKPIQLTQAIKEASHDYHTLLADKRVNEWKDKEVLAGRTVDPLILPGKKNNMKSDFDTGVENGAKSLLIRDMGAPEFVIADSNWGGPLDHTTFVIAPDPTTGEPIMWEKTEPPGSLSPSGRKWVDDEWAHVS